LPAAGLWRLTEAVFPAHREVATKLW